MRTLIRTAGALAGLLVILALGATTVLAGGYATATIVDDGTGPPTAGESGEVRVSLLQHGVTPVNDGEVHITATLPGTDERLSVPATSLGGGEWTATITFPADGDWQLRVTHSDLETPAASAFAVAAPAASSLLLLGALAVVLAGGLLTGAFLMARRRRAGVPADPAREPAPAG